MLSQRFSSLRNAGNGGLEGKIGNNFFGWKGGGGGGREGMAPEPEIAPEELGRHSPSTPLVMKVRSIVYNPLPEIPGSAPALDHRRSLFPCRTVTFFTWGR